MNKQKWLALTLSCTMLLALVTGCGGTKGEAPPTDDDSSPSTTKETVEVRIAHGLAETDPVHIGFLAMKESLEAADVNMTVKIFPNGQLSGSDRDLIEGIQFGEFDITSVAASNLAPTISDYYVFNANYLFDSLQDARDTLTSEVGNSFTATANEQSAQSGIRGLGFFGGTMQSIWTTNREILSIDDFANLKVRSAENPINIAELEAVGATATPVAWGELYTALQQGTVDAMFSNRVTAMQQFGDVYAYGTYLAHNIYLPVPIASEDFYTGLNDAQKAAFDAAMEIGINAQWDAVFELDTSIVAELEALTEEGSLIYTQELSDTDKAAFQTAFIDSTESLVAELCGQETLDIFRN